jgi:pimeloyl-ACP methyl ester carboxylesterase
MIKSAATIVLVHGAWADGSSWNKVIPLLLAKGFAVIAVQIPLTSVEDDLAATNRILAGTQGPIILVGHSWGGMAITQAGIDQKVVALVYVSAFVPDVGETGSSLIGAHPTPPALSTIVTDSTGFVYQTADGMVKNIAPDLPVDVGCDAGAPRGKSIWTNRYRRCLEDKSLLVHRYVRRPRGQYRTPSG